MEGPNVLVERKTKRGKIGAIGPEGLVWRPDAGRRYEEGHVLVLALPAADFNVRDLRETLQRADTWRAPGWIDNIERKERQAVADRKRSRSHDMRYKAVEVFDRYVWKHKQRTFGGL